MAEVTVLIGGAAGQGLVTASNLLLQLLARSGHNVFAVQDYMSRVRGGHNFMQIRISDNMVNAKTERPHVLVALDQRTVDEHLESLEKPAVVLHDAATRRPPREGVTFVGAPLGSAGAQGEKIFVNAVAFGAVVSLLGLHREKAKQLLSSRFEKKGTEATEMNLSSFATGYDAVKTQSHLPTIRLPEPRKKGMMLINGAQAIGLGMMAGGLRFISAYPMSPSTSIFNYVAKHAARFGILSEQAEDEIAAINMATGAAAAGARAAVSTSGGGLDLMAEGISFAGVSEAPVVIANIQRPGPATGLPTRTAQEDLDLVLNIGHGEFPRFVFAPGTVEEAFYTSVHAMNMADKYQVPVFILGDQFLVDSYTTLPGLDLEKYEFENFLADEKTSEKPYKRYLLTPDGVSPRLPFGAPEARVMFDSHLHDETGHITEEAETVLRMTEKRFNKVMGMSYEPFKPVRYGHEKPSLTLVCWGSTYGAVREAVDLLNASGEKAEMVHFNRLSPFPVMETEQLLKGKRSVHVVEGNYTSQLSQLITRETGIKTGEPVVRYDGRPFTANYVLNGLEVDEKWKVKTFSITKGKRRGARVAVTSGYSTRLKRR